MSKIRVKRGVKIPRKFKPKSAKWSGKGTYKTMERYVKASGEREYTIERGTLRLGNRYYRVTEKVGGHIIEATKELKELLESNKITREEYDKSYDRIIHDLESKRIGYEGLRDFDIGRTGLFFENLLSESGISDALFKENVKKLLSDDELKVVEEFKKNMKKIEGSRVLQQQLYDKVSPSFNKYKDFYKTLQSGGGVITQEEAQDMVGTLEEINKAFDDVFQRKIDNYVKK